MAFKVYHFTVSQSFKFDRWNMDQNTKEIKTRTKTTEVNSQLDGSN